MKIKNFKVENHVIGKGNPTFIIAEIGATHDGSFDQAIKLIKLAKESGAQAVKLQTVVPEHSYCEGTLSFEVFKKLLTSQ